MNQLPLGFSRIGTHRVPSKDKAVPRLVPRFVPILIAIPILLLCSGPAAAQEIIGQARVINGDTIDIGDKRIRLHGIDAAEGGQICLDENVDFWGCGAAATEKLGQLVAGKSVKCIPIARQPDGRQVAKCFVDRRDIGKRMVRSGLAVAFRQLSKEYDGDEKAARAQRLGLWRGENMMPREWRRRRQ